ncbi:DUF1016 N-terminal domain-containing protein [Parapedobacter pyrenivorans]|uniref:DUF1016 N-terminal domain-containing protein n=1 Tax=Parapedobacter pyrenivorans TaxID=1305674 RepID=UPI00166A048C
MRTFPDEGQIQQTLSAKLSWSHFQLIMRVSDPKARQYYLKEAGEQNWACCYVQKQTGRSPSIRY